MARLSDRGKSSGDLVDQKMRLARFIISGCKRSNLCELHWSCQNWHIANVDNDRGIMLSKDPMHVGTTNDYPRSLAAKS